MMEIVQNGTDPLAQARELIAQETKKTEELCFAEVSEVLQRRNCQFVITAQVAGQKVPAAAILNLPLEIMIEALK